MNKEEKIINEYADFICSGITLEEPNIFIYPKSKKEQVSFKIYDIMTAKQVGIIARTNVKYYLKKQLHAREWWSFQGYYNQDKTTFYVSRATLTFDKDYTKRALSHLKEVAEDKLKKVETI